MFDSELVADFWQAVATQGRMNLHVLFITVGKLATSARPSSKGWPGRSGPPANAEYPRRGRPLDQREPMMTAAAPGISRSLLINLAWYRGGVRPAGAGDPGPSGPDRRGVQPAGASKFPPLRPGVRDLPGRVVADTYARWFWLVRVIRSGVPAPRRGLARLHRQRLQPGDPGRGRGDLIKAAIWSR